MSINQRAYLESIAKRFNLSKAKPVRIPMDPGVTLSKDQGPTLIAEIMEMRNVPYAEAIGSALWAAMVSQPNITFALGILAQFIQNLAEIHWSALKWVLTYLSTTKDLWLTLGGDVVLNAVGYCDADWASQPHRHSISGYAFYFGGGVVSWSLKKQQVILLSSTEAEYISSTHVAKEALWLRTFVSELHSDSPHLVTLNCDNQGAIALSKDNKFHVWTKHIDL